LVIGQSREPVPPAKTIPFIGKEYRLVLNFGRTEEEMNLLITGGAGFIGSNFVRRIFDGTLAGIENVTVLDKLTYAGTLTNLEKVKNEKNFTFIEGDICDSKIVSSALKNIDAVINFAAESHVDKSISSASEFIETNVRGVQVLLDEIKSLKEEMRFIQISTDEVYGTIASGSWDESQPLLPNSPYSASKASGELIARAYQKTHGMDIVITRCSNNYGTHHFPEKLIPLFITNLIEGKKVPVYGKGLNVRDWLHVDDHCQAIYKVLNNGVSGEIYNIGGGEELSNLEITKLILSEMRRDESSIEYVEDRKGHDFRYSIDCKKIMHDLHYEPKVNFRDGLRETIEWFVNNKTWWEPLKK
jgi:dTDP-glucose 4,6-dehydratase